VEARQHNAGGGVSEGGMIVGEGRSVW